MDLVLWNVRKTTRDVNEKKIIFMNILILGLNHQKRSPDIIIQRIEEIMVNMGALV